MESRYPKLRVMERIGDDLLIPIFEKLHNEHDRKSFSKVSKQFLKVACIFVKVLRVSSPDVLKNILLESPNKVEFKCFKPLSNAYMKLLARLSPKLQKLDLALVSNYNPCELDFDDDGLCTVANACSHLRQIDLSMRLRVGDLGVDSIMRSCKNLQELDLEGCLSVTDESLKAIGESNSLLKLNLRGSLISDLGLEYIANGNLKNSLEKLILNTCDRISDLGVESIVRSCKKLQEFCLSGCQSITDKSLEAIGESNSLHILYLSDCLITDEGLFNLTLGNLQQSLTQLDLDGCERISDDGVCYLNEFDNLTDLTLSMCCCCLSDDAIRAIAHIPYIEFLGICLMKYGRY